MAKVHALRFEMKDSSNGDSAKALFELSTSTRKRSASTQTTDATPIKANEAEVVNRQTEASVVAGETTRTNSGRLRTSAKS